MELKAEDLINVNDRFNPGKKREPKIDEVVSKIVGKAILQVDPRLLKLVAKWKKNDNKDDNVKDLNNFPEFDNYFEDPKKIVELKQVFA